MLLPQYFVITTAEILFSITGYAFSYSEAPASMKSVIQAVWLLTNAAGSFIVILVTELNLFPRQVNNKKLQLRLFNNYSNSWPISDDSILFLQRTHVSRYCDIYHFRILLYASTAKQTSVNIYEEDHTSRDDGQLLPAQ